MRLRGIVRTLLLCSAAAGSAAAVANCGSNGDTGPAGPAGDSGAAGAPGAAGATGAAGAAGAAGGPGATGAAGATGATGSAGATGPGADGGIVANPADPASALPTATKIKHLVVIFGENVSFDHYFGTYPVAANTDGAPFVAAPNTPQVNNLSTPLDPTKGFAPIADAGLLAANPTSTNIGNGANAINPFRIPGSTALTRSQNHNYMPEQQAADDGKMDLSPAFTGHAGPPPGTGGAYATTGLVMGYFDGNVVSGMWSLAQNYALNDNAWTSQFGPSSPGAVNLISGQTNGVVPGTGGLAPIAGSVVSDGNGGYTLIGDIDPSGDVCSASNQGSLSGKNVGDLLNAANVSWGWFQGGFDLTVENANATTGCNRSSTLTVTDGLTPVVATDYVPHHAPFQYYASTANPNHLRPSSVTAVGHTLEDDGKTTDPANHQYDSHDFFDALKAGNFPAVSYLKAPAFQDGHPGNSDPIDEQNFINQVVTAVQSSGDWSTTAIVLTYDDSDGWYDHQAPPIVNASASIQDALNAPPADGGAGLCNTANAQQGGDGGAAGAVLGGNDGGAAQGRCGYGTRVPLLVISPFAKKNYVDHTLTDQSSVLRFVEDNWVAGKRIQPGGSYDTIAGTIENMFSF